MGSKNVSNRYFISTDDNLVKRDFQDFFDNWGQFVVIRAYGGGSMEIQFTCRKDKNSSEEDGLINAKAEISTILSQMAVSSPSFSTTAQSSNSSLQSGSSFSASSMVNWNGGDTNHQVCTK